MQSDISTLLTSSKHPRKKNLDHMQNNHYILHKHTLEKINKPIIILSDDMILEANSSFVDFVGYQREDLIRHNFFHLIHPDDQQKTYQNFQKWSNGIINQNINRFRLITSNHSIRWVETNTLLLTMNTTPVTLCCFFDDTHKTQLESDTENLKQLMERKTHELNESLIQRDLLLEEIHHRVKNNLQIITSLIDLQCQTQKNFEQCTFFQNLKNRIYIMSLLHEQLYKSKDFTHVNLGNYLKGIVENLEQSLNIKSKKITINILDSTEVIDLKKAISCGLIINELISNAIKHAFPDSNDGQITLEISSFEDEYIITVEDNGIGLSSDMKSSQRSTLGLQLVHMLIDQLHGTIDIDTKKGTKISLRFPKT